MNSFWNTRFLLHIVTILCGAAHSGVHSTPTAITIHTTSTMSNGDGTNVTSMNPNNTSVIEDGVTATLSTTLTFTTDDTNHTWDDGNKTAFSSTVSNGDGGSVSTMVTMASTEHASMETTSTIQDKTSKENKIESTATTRLSKSSTGALSSVRSSDATVRSTLLYTSYDKVASTHPEPTSLLSTGIVSSTVTKSNISMTTTIFSKSLTTHFDDGHDGNAKVAAAVVSVLLIVFFLAVLLILWHRGKVRLYRRVSTGNNHPAHNATTFRDISQAASKRASRLYSSLFRDRTTRQHRPRIEIEIIRTSLRKAESPRSKIRGILSLHSSMPILSVSSDDDQQEAIAKHSSLADVAGASNDQHVCEINQDFKSAQHSTEEPIKEPDVKAMTLPRQSTRKRSFSMFWDDRWSRRRLSQDMKRRSKKSKRPSSARHTWTLENRPATNDSVCVVDVKKDEPIVVYVKRENRERDTVDIRLSVSNTTESLSVKPRQSGDLDGAGDSHRGSFQARRSFNPFSGRMLSFTKRASSNSQEESGNARPPKPRRGVLQ